MRALRLFMAILGAAFFFVSGGLTVHWMDTLEVQKLEAKVEANLLYLAAPLYECRAGREWLGIDTWKAERPGCDIHCAVRLLLLQAQAEAENTSTVAAK